MLTRTSSFMSEGSWATEPWQSIEKSQEQALYDHGFILTALFEDLDQLDVDNVDEDAAASDSRFLTRCDRLDAALQAFETNLTNTGSSLVLDTEGITVSETVLVFPDLQAAMLAMNVWCLQLNLTKMIAHAGARILNDRMSSTSTGTDSASTAEAQNQIHRLLARHDDARMHRLATSTIDVIAYCFRQDMGLAAAQSLVMAMWSLVLHYQMQPESEYTRRCNEFYQKLVNEKGVKLATPLAALE